jgi:hypothetical protein
LRDVLKGLLSKGEKVRLRFRMQNAVLYSFDV